MLHNINLDKLQCKPNNLRMIKPNTYKNISVPNHKPITHDDINRKCLNKMTVCTEAMFKVFATRLPQQFSIKREILKIPLTEQET